MYSPTQHHHHVTHYFKATVISMIVLGVVYAVIFGCYSLLVGVLSTACGNEVLNEVYSPDNQYKAVTFQGSCGATTRLHTDISILRANQTISNLSHGNIYSSSDVVELQVIWSGNRKIEIKSTTSKPLVEKMQFNYDNENFEISYRNISRE